MTTRGTELLKESYSLGEDILAVLEKPENLKYLLQWLEELRKHIKNQQDWLRFSLLNVCSPRTE